MAKVLIDMPERMGELIHSDSQIDWLDMSHILYVVRNGIALDGLTNGEVMQMLLSNAELHWTNECEYGLRPLDSNWIIWFKGDWWNRKWGE